MARLGQVANGYACEGDPSFVSMHALLVTLVAIAKSYAAKRPEGHTAILAYAPPEKANGQAARLTLSVLPHVEGSTAFPGGGQ